MRRLIGRGGMGDVFLAWDTRLQRDVAVKQLRPEFVTDPDVLARFDREAHALARVSHPAVIHVYDRLTGPDGAAPCRGRGASASARRCAGPWRPRTGPA